MLLINQRLDKLSATRANFASRGMLKGTYLSYVWDRVFLDYIAKVIDYDDRHK